MQFVQTFSIKYSYLQKHNYTIKENPLHKRKYWHEHSAFLREEGGTTEVVEGARAIPGLCTQYSEHN